MTSKELAIILRDILSEYRAINDETPLKAVNNMHVCENEVQLILNDGSEFRIEITQSK